LRIEAGVDKAYPDEPRATFGQSISRLQRASMAAVASEGFQ
jgi:hypothetical protein